MEQEQLAASTDVNQAQHVTINELLAASWRGENRNDHVRTYRTVGVYFGPVRMKGLVALVVDYRGHGGNHGPAQAMAVLNREGTVVFIDEDWRGSV